MEDIKVKTNQTDLAVKIEGIPNYTNMPTVERNVFINKYEKVVFEIFEKYLKRKK